MAIVEAPLIANATCGACGTNYTASIGETLESVAAYCKISLRDAADANPGINSTANLTGLPLRIPCRNSDPAHCGTCGASYVIKEQDILFDIAHSCGMDLAELEMANRDIDFENVYPGQLIRIPCEADNATIALTGCGACGIEYTATTNGEPLNQVARDCGTSIQELSLANPGLHLSSNSTMIQGQKLRIPCNSTASCGPCGNSYTILHESRRQVAAKCRVGFIDLQASNPSTDLDDLQPGQRLTIPCKQRTAPGIKCSGHLCDTTIVVKNSSSVFDVAKLCNVTPALVSYANGIPENGVIYPGQSLAIPCEDSPAPLRSCSICGSTVSPLVAVDLATVARVCGVSVKGIQEATNIKLADVAFGDVLSIPCHDEDVGCGPCGVAYKAVDGDTLPSIAVKCSTIISDIQMANPALNASEPVAGKLVSIPCRLSAVSLGASVLSNPRELVVVLLVVLLLRKTSELALSGRASFWTLEVLSTGKQVSTCITLNNPLENSELSCGSSSLKTKRTKPEWSLPHSSDVIWWHPNELPAQS
ncbi:hypothetical protein SELMODRAFT_416289 [Selaginella moellendorffii]|uniref:LysM domain-containing protein n=1 Tax=Selaginella moellendorffii TaxID=88036 RepID=D8RYT8_SELML|nr:hypothetical protein SELMODRAFT_416289 [Selaginella moellendorffii]